MHGNLSQALVMTSYNIVDLRYYKDVLGGLRAPAMGAHLGFLTCQVVIKLWIAGRI